MRTPEATAHGCAATIKDAVDALTLLGERTSPLAKTLRAACIESLSHQAETLESLQGPRPVAPFRSVRQSDTPDTA